MALMKRATQRLHKLGADQNIEIHKVLFGYCLRDKRLKKQASLVYDTPQLCVDAYLHGERPEQSEAEGFHK